MTYKGILLSALLVPVSTMYCFQDVDLQLQNLNNAQIKKLQELSNISVKIAAKQDLIESWRLQIEPILESLEKAERQVLEDSLGDFLQEMDRAFCESKDIKGLLTKDFSIGDNTKYAFNFIKVSVIRICLERALMANLVSHYERCLQELIEMIG